MYKPIAMRRCLVHFKSLLHVRDHAKVQGTAHHLLEHIAIHTNMHTGEAFELTVDRLAHRLEVTPQWVGQLRRRLVESGELIVKQSRGRRPNVYIIPYERCPACQKVNPKLEFQVNEIPEDRNPKVTPGQPQSEMPPTPNSPHANPKVGETSTPPLAWIEQPKEVKDLKDLQERSTRIDDDDGALPKAEQASPFWCQACGFAIPTCRHRLVYGSARGKPGWRT
jgi:hypothetical protein